MSGSRTGPFVLAAIVIVGCLMAGVLLGIFANNAPSLVISVVFACAVATLLYCILGSVGEAGFNLGPIKMCGSAAVLIGSAFLFNMLLEPQLEDIRGTRLKEALERVKFDFDIHAKPSGSWFAINRDTGAPVSVEFIDPVSREVNHEVKPPSRANLRFKLEPREDSSDHLVSGVDADTGLGYIEQQNLERVLGLIGDLEPGATYGPKRLYLTNEGELPPNNPRVWGDGKCVGTRLPLQIKVNKFQDGFADHEVFPCESDDGIESSLRSGEAALHQVRVDGSLSNFVIAVVAADHRAPPFWSSFVVIEMVKVAE